MDFTLFYAWQSDSRLDDNKHLIRDAARDAIKRVARDAEVEESPRLDHDTKDLPGSPEVASSIFSKIERCGMFLGDVTFVAAYRSSDGREKRAPNPNVAIELGYAGRSIGWDRVILVMNTAYGHADDQVFDIKHRRNPICFELSESAEQGTRKSVRASLSVSIESAIHAHMRSEHQAAKDIVAVLDKHCIEVLTTYANLNYFPGPEIKTMGDALSFQPILHAITRLLELRLIRCDVHPSSSKYAYHWTYLGTRILVHLGLRVEAST